MSVSSSRPEDRATILEINHAVGAFDEEDALVLAELFDGYVKDPVASGYNFLSFRDAETDAVLGFVCWGPTSLSRGAVDFYWLATAPAAQRRGVGNALFQAAEDAARAMGRWVVTLWTSSRPEYAAARNMYIRRGYEHALRIPDFYDRGDDLMVYTLRL